MGEHVASTVRRSLVFVIVSVAACGSVDDASIGDDTDSGGGSAGMDGGAPIDGAGSDADMPGEEPTPDAPVVPAPAISFATPAAQVSEFALDGALAITTTPVAITIVRSGVDLTAPATVTLGVAPASTAIGQVHFTAQSGSTLAATGTQILELPAQAAGVTSQQVTLTIYPRYNREPSQSTKQLLLDVVAVTGAASLPMLARHTTTFVGAGDRAYGGVEIPETMSLGAYAGAAENCEGWGPGGLRTPSPGAGGHPPCGSYRIPLGAQLTHPHYGRCNAGMRNDVSMPGSGLANMTNSVLGVKMLVEENLQRGNTHIGGNSLTFSQDANEAFIIKFRTGAAGDYDLTSGLSAGAIGGLSFLFAPHTSQGPEAARFAALSTSPCDFDYVQEAAANPCFRQLGTFDALHAEILPTGSSTTGKCTLRPNTTYYLSMRWENPDAPGYISCRPAVGSPYANNCGTVLGIQ